MAQYAKATEALKLVPKMDGVSTDDLDTYKIASDVRRTIDTELRGRYVLPFATTGTGATEEASEETVRQIAEYLMAGLMIQLRFTEDAPGKVPSNFWWQKGMALLNRVRAGRLDLDPANATVDTTGTYQGKRIHGKRADYPPSFNKGNELDWRKPVIDTEGDRDQLDPDDYMADF